MQDKEDHKNRKKMNTLELLYNKALMKAAADNTSNVKKGKVWFDSFKWRILGLLYSIESRELQIGNLSAIPTGVLLRAFESRQFTEAGFVGETLLLTLP